MAKTDLENARQLYPSCSMGESDWIRFFNTPRGLNTMGRMIYDVYDEALSGDEYAAGLRRIGRRPRREAVPLRDVLDVVMHMGFGEEFTNDLFPVALAKLMRGRTQGQFALRIPMSQPNLSKILSGAVKPSLPVIESIADAAGVHPWYFVEWRAQFIGDLISEVFTKQPRLGIAAMKTIRQGRRVHDLEEQP